MTPMKAFGETSVLVGMPIRHATCTVTRKRLMDHRRGLFSSRARYQCPVGIIPGDPSSYYYAMVDANTQ